MSTKKRTKKQGTEQRQRTVAAPGGPVPVTTGPILSDESLELYSDLVLVGGVACDWLTLTTTDVLAYRSMQAYTIAPDTTRRIPIRAARRMQYQGWQGDGWFVGEGKQQGDPHYMVQAWGARAQDVLRYALAFHEMDDVVRCTRIDLQVTAEDTFAADMPAVAEVLRISPAEAWKGRGPRPKVSYFSNEDSADTMYLGTRNSTRMWRFYNKRVNQRLLLRVELEAKEWLAQNIWQEACDHGMFHVKHALERELGVLPVVLLNMIESCNVTPSDLGKHPRPEEDRNSLLATRDWLLEVVLPCLTKTLATEVGAEVLTAYRRAVWVDSDG